MSLLSEAHFVSRKIAAVFLLERSAVIYDISILL